MRSRFVNLFGYLLVLFACSHVAETRDQPKDFRGYPNHHLHTFGGLRAASKHAVEMGYYLVANNKPEGSRYDRLGVIKCLNANVGPIRVYQNNKTGQVYVKYHRWLERGRDNLNPLAAMHGLARKNGTLYPISYEDMEILKNYSAARADNTDLRVENLSIDLIQNRFYPAWILEKDGWISCNLRGNWESKKVVDDMVEATVSEFPWAKYRALFFDSFGAVLNGNVANRNFGDKGNYDSWAHGKLDLVRRITAYARNVTLTGQDKPYAVFANIWNPKRRSLWETVLRWYADGILRLDHYYFEKGGLGSQAPNGTVPFTDRPAYVDPVHPTQAYLPASKVSLDDEYGFNRKDFDGVDDYDRARHFQQHLDACGTAGLYGAWFGWYGEDAIDLKHNGHMIYTNDLQLLRAIPNWDNIAGIPVPSYKQSSPDDQRTWDGEVYRSPNSYASADVIYARNPFNKELYIVFLSFRGKVELQPDEQVITALFVDDLFGKTDVDALQALKIQDSSIKLKEEYKDRLKQGIRITLIKKRPTATVIESSTYTRR